MRGEQDHSELISQDLEKVNLRNTLQSSLGSILELLNSLPPSFSNREVVTALITKAAKIVESDTTVLEAQKDIESVQDRIDRRWAEGQDEWRRDILEDIKERDKK